MKLIFSLVAALTLAAPVKADVEILSPDFVLFGKTSGDYGAEWFKYMFGLSTNFDYLLPKAGPLNDERVYFLQRPATIFLVPGVQTYFVPDDVYVFFPFPAYEWDNVDSCPPCFTVEELRQILATYVGGITDVHLVTDGTALQNASAYRTQSPVFSVNLPTSDNIETIIVGHPIDGLIDPIVADGYFAMLAPLSPGLHDVRSQYTIGAPNGFSVERHFQIYSLTTGEWLERQIDQLATMVANSSLSRNRQQPLIVSLNAAEASFDSNNLRAGINQLGAFQNKVRAQIAPTDELLAEQLMQAAQSVLDKAAARINSNQRL